MAKYRLTRPGEADTGAMGQHEQTRVVEAAPDNAPPGGVRVSDDTPVSDWRVHVPNPHELPKAEEGG